tara:strand:+ start:1076 stop:1720 length:645 start_codon:yes stop_codon:yes gene_type:complete
MKPKLDKHEIAKLVFERFKILYRPPASMKEEEKAQRVFAEYIRALQYYDTDQINAAIDEIIDTRTKTTWPSIPEIRKAIAKTRSGDERPSSQAAKINPAELEPEQYDALMWSTAGQQAIADGYARGYWHFIHTLHRAPNIEESNTLKQDHIAAKQLAQNLTFAAPMGATLIALWQRLEKHNQELADRYNRNGAPPSPAKSDQTTDDPFDEAFGV